MLDSAQIESPVGTFARGASQNTMTHPCDLTRQATLGRGGSTGLRPFRRGKGGAPQRVEGRRGGAVPRLEFRTRTQMNAKAGPHQHVGMG